MLASLVHETLNPFLGESVVICVDECARLYSNILFFRHGIADTAPHVKTNTCTRWIAEYNRFAESIYDFVRRHNGDHQRDEYKARFLLDPSAFTLSSDLYVAKGSPIGKWKGVIPEHEMLFDASR